MNRKDDHIKYALNQNIINNDFDKVRFVHNAISNISFNDIDLSTSICGIKIPLPIYINAMTGGTKNAQVINEKLAKIANHFKIPIASGSLSIAIKNQEAKESFQIIRKLYRNGIVIANIGADKSLNDAKEAINILDADILQIHLNIVQEVIMPEGERDFSQWELNISEIVENVGIPVIIKEVGFGMSNATINTLKKLGVKTIDVSGYGGTNFAEIENSRRDTPLSYLNNWGLSTVESLLEACNIEDIEILASGGIRNALDVVKALALGANAVGLSSYFLKLVSNYSLEEAIDIIENMINDIKSIMTILGAKSVNDLKYKEIIFDESLISYMKQRSINQTILIRRI